MNEGFTNKNGVADVFGLVVLVAEVNFMAVGDDGMRQTRTVKCMFAQTPRMSKSRNCPTVELNKGKMKFSLKNQTLWNRLFNAVCRVSFKQNDGR